MPGFVEEEPIPVLVPGEGGALVGEFGVAEGELGVPVGELGVAVGELVVVPGSVVPGVGVVVVFGNVPGVCVPPGVAEVPGVVVVVPGVCVVVVPGACVMPGVVDVDPGALCMPVWPAAPPEAVPALPVPAAPEPAPPAPPACANAQHPQSSTVAAVKKNLCFIVVTFVLTLFELEVRLPIGWAPPIREMSAAHRIHCTKQPSLLRRRAGRGNGHVCAAAARAAFVYTTRASASPEGISFSHVRNRGSAKRGRRSRKKSGFGNGWWVAELCDREFFRRAF